ncbi:uncharacterized protein LOC119766275 [Culex quinquefasciatus]|uniref:uncharacterized protein LOC119766275 n=1 Tax=Culex quinquefasciatus TaxID=7176 RepID=UPI0018E37E7F|nr:uncharacterized protein LOC119766275 [Culex quinquefasciatus]
MINNNDYDAAWALLTLRYEDKRIVVDKLVEKLYGLPKNSQEDAAELRKVIDTCTKNVDALKNQELPMAWLGEQMLVNLIVGKIEKKLQVAWEAKQKKNVLSTYAALMAFLEEQCRISENLDTKVKPVKESAKPKTAGRSHTLAVSESKNEQKCAVCKAAHELWKCEAFKNKSVSDKYEILKKCGACFNCLMKGHRTRACSSGSCRYCGKKHHSSLHEESPSQVPNSAAQTTHASEVSQTANTPAAGTSTTLCASAASSEKQTVLSTAVFLVDGKCNTPIPCRVLLDSASQMNFVTERFANLLSLKLKPADFTVSGLSGNKTRISRRLRAAIRLRGNSFEVTDDSSKTMVKTLGVTWNPFEDWFSVSVPDFDDLEEVTRRKLLSQLAKIFDPLGFFGPVITYAKLILREVGELHIEWDDVCWVGEKWRSFRIELTALREVRLPRWISWKGALKLELHGYADASDLAYGACIYVKGFFANEATEMRLIYSKSRILPKKRKPKEKAISTPRAELLAALLLARMVVKFLSATEHQFESVHLWRDSQIVLAWLKKLPQLLQTFVSNRKLIKFKKWWQGRPRTTVAAAADEIVIPDDELPEMRTGVVLAMTAPVERFPMFDKLSSFTGIVRSMAYLMRLARFVKSRKTEVVKGRLTAKEMRTATLVVAFQPEILALMDGADTNHRLNGLKAFRSPDDGLLRVGGRIKGAFVPYDSRHQMLLPAKHPITEALVRELHVDNLHIGQRGLLAVVRQRFWPLNVKSTIRQVIRKCIVCFKTNPLKTTQLMGDLPSYRVQPAPVFSNTGVDYAGPFWIRSSSATHKPQITKAYVCLFVCLQTRAIHLELVSDLTTDVFLASLRRFASRRGCPKTMHSDNGTNFVGAKTKLHELWQMFQNECATKKIASYCIEKGIEWSFIPPRSPHFGGIWEAGVKQVKHHLKRIVGERKLSYEELYTTLTQIEAVLNSRPLVPSSDDPSDYTAITPAHFLIGREMQAVPEPDYSHLKENRLSRWQLVQTMLQHFWRRWTAEYLPELQNRSKWLKTKFETCVSKLTKMENNLHQVLSINVEGSSKGDGGYSFICLDSKWDVNNRCGPWTPGDLLTLNSMHNDLHCNRKLIEFIMR